MKSSVLVAVAVVLGRFIAQAAAEAPPYADPPAPIQFTDLEKAGFAKPFFRNLRDDERAAFYRAYPPDQEMLDRVTLGDGVKLEECIAGEAPNVSDAFEKFSVHYPMLGRMKAVSGRLEWKDGRLIFRTAGQQYHVDEFHIVYRLEQLGFTNKSEPRTATLDAVWTVNRIDALRLLFVEKITLR